MTSDAQAEGPGAQPSVGIPQSASSSRHVTARLTSSELELLP